MVVGTKGGIEIQWGGEKAMMAGGARWESTKEDISRERECVRTVD